LRQVNKELDAHVYSTQKNTTEEKIEVRVDANIAGMLKEYAEFSGESQGYVVTEILLRRSGRIGPSRSGSRGARPGLMALVPS